MPTTNYVELNVKACYADLFQVTTQLNGVLQEAGITSDMVSKVHLVVEELFTNSIVHGYRLECDMPICIRVSWQDPHIMVRYADLAPAFDPRSTVTDGEIKGIGGKGLHLIRKLPAWFDYHSENDWNVTELTFVKPECKED